MGKNILSWFFIVLLSLCLGVAWFIGVRWWIIAVIPVGVLLVAISIFLCCLWRAFGLPRKCSKHEEWSITGACIDCFDDKIERRKKWKADKDTGN